MAVFRVERNKGYTVMSNHHLRNKELTLYADTDLTYFLSPIAGRMDNLASSMGVQTRGIKRAVLSNLLMETEWTALFLKKWQP